MIAGENIPRQLSVRTRWIIHVAILCVPILLSVFSFSLGHPAKLPHSGSSLARFVFSELLMWGLAFAAAFRMSRITITQLCLRVPSLWRVIVHGIGYFVLVRIVIIPILGVQMRLLHGKSGWSGSETVFSMMDPHGIAQHPGFSLLVFGITSLLAGLTEELWRVGMLRGLQALFPSLRGTRWGAIVCIILVSLIFGIAHLYLGWLGVENAFLLGLLFGLIVIYRHSYWEAAIAHTLFDASSFALVVFIALNPQIINPTIVTEAGKGDIPMVGHLLKVGGDINGTMGTGKFTPLEAAEAKGHHEMVGFLLDAGANPNAVDANGNTTLIIAAEAGDLVDMKALAAKGADLNLRNKRGETALRFAVANKHPDAVQLLIDLGADVNIADSQGITPLAAARSYGYENSAALLEKNAGK